MTCGAGEMGSPRAAFTLTASPQPRKMVKWLRYCHFITFCGGKATGSKDNSGATAYGLPSAEFW